MPPTCGQRTGTPPGEAVACLQLVESRGEHLGSSRNRDIGLLSAWHSVLPSGGPASCPLGGAAGAGRSGATRQ